MDQTAVSFITGAEVHCGTGERKLLNDLMTFYQKLERPVANESEAVQLRFGLTLQQIMDVVREPFIKLVKQRADSPSLSLAHTLISPELDWSVESSTLGRKDWFITNTFK